MDATLTNLDVSISLDDFVKFYLTLVSNSLNHLNIHSVNTSHVSVELATQLGYSCRDLKLLEYGSILHDIGKLFVPVEILNKSRRLSAAEFELIKMHPVAGFEVLSKFASVPREISVLAIKHHYRHGFGYPAEAAEVNGIDPVLVDILTVADSFSAIMEPRVYKDKIVAENAYGIMLDPANVRNKGMSEYVLDALGFLIEKDKLFLSDFFV